MQMTNEQMKTIGGIIRSVTASQSKRFYKAELNTAERSEFVFLAIRDNIRVALLDAGLPPRMVDHEIDPTDDILSQMIQDGYTLSLEQLGVVRR